MAKKLTQIAFDFGNFDSEPVVQKEEKHPIAVVKEVSLIREEEPIAPPVKKKSTRGRRSIKETEAKIGLVNIPEDDVLFQKRYYSMKEVAEMFNENQSLIRYWETEFDILQPKKNGKGDRFFRPVDVKNLMLIYDLLRKRKFTIEGAKDYLKKNKKAEDNFSLIQSLEQMKSFFLELKAHL